MGGRSGTGTRNSAPAEFKYDEPVLEPLKPTQYAREIFKENYREARGIVESRGDHEPFQMRSLYWDEFQKVMSKQTLRGVQALINTKKKEIDVDVEFGILTPEEAQNRRVALNAVQKTLNEQWNRK